MTVDTDAHVQPLVTRMMLLWTACSRALVPPVIGLHGIVRCSVHDLGPCLSVHLAFAWPRHGARPAPHDLACITARLYAATPSCKDII